MRPKVMLFLGGLVALLLTLPAGVVANDVDGPDDCRHAGMDFGDAPEFIPAYPGVPGHFPTCKNPSPPGTQEIACTPPRSTPPGQTGFVAHFYQQDGYWLGCPVPGALPMGIDSDPDGKVSPGAGLPSVCSNQPVDCLEAAFGLNFGQDECTGDNDAGVMPPQLLTCTTSQVQFMTYNCGPTRQVFLNILIDMNRDGDWNDNFQCPGACAYEWAVKNVPIVLPPGCFTHTSPGFLVGPHPGESWMRVTISNFPVNDDFPWAGSVTMGGELQGGETEDYPVMIEETQPDPCDIGYEEFGDAPEDLTAYSSGIVGHFPTCTFPSAPGTQELFCAPISTPPGQTGFVMHVAQPTDPVHFWLGCPSVTAGFPGIDGEPNGKVNLLPNVGDPSWCDPSLATDCVEAAFANTFNQDECYGDLDAGVAAPIQFTACTFSSVSFQAYSCTNVDAFLNILVDWNEDGDWNDNFACSSPVVCSYEWVVKNVPIQLAPGCQTVTSPQFGTGPHPGEGWMRITLSREPVLDDFPWNGSMGHQGQALHGGETEDYPVTIQAPDPCELGYEEFGDAPEALKAYSSGTLGHFPSCLFQSAAGTQEIECGAPLSTAPGPTGVVKHVAVPTDPVHFWLGCPSATGFPGVDSEPDGKLNLAAVLAPSHCNQSVLTDCVEAAFGLSFGQDECYGDLDAGIASPLKFTACTPSTVTFTAYSCAQAEVYLNILVDWNEDGDWNDNIHCPGTGGCAHEWVVKNHSITLTPGCQTLTSPQFLAGPHAGEGWLRITLTQAPVADDFPWNGSGGGPAIGVFENGETEDYPVEIVPPEDPCDFGYEDFGDAPENLMAYPGGVMGRFPTCLFPSAAGTQEIQCGAPMSPPPGPTGFVRHFSAPDDPFKVWLGCGLGPGAVPGGIDSEPDGKVQLGGPLGGPSHCHDNPTDCIEPAFGLLQFNQDECYGDGVDAGLQQPPTFVQCRRASVTFKAFNCRPGTVTAFLNILVDWNQDGDWNDNVRCPPCAPEWAVRNVPFPVASGCGTYTSPQFNVGPKAGPTWMRITITREPVRPDFPWNGSVSMPMESFQGGETEDYPVRIQELTGVDEGDLPETLNLAVVPNPSRSDLAIRYALPRATEVSIRVYDITGRTLRTLVAAAQPAGEHSVRWDYRTDDGIEAPPGHYFVKLRAEGRVITRSIIRIR